MTGYADLARRPTRAIAADPNRLREVTVGENQDVVCALHEAITRGLLAEMLPDSSLTRFELHDPERAGCIVAVSGSDGR